MYNNLFKIHTSKNNKNNKKIYNYFLKKENNKITLGIKSQDNLSVNSYSNDIERLLNSMVTVWGGKYSYKLQGKINNDMHIFSFECEKKENILKVEKKLLDKLKDFQEKEKEEGKKVKFDRMTEKEFYPEQNKLEQNKLEKNWKLQIKLHG